MLVHTETKLPWSPDVPIDGVRYPLNIEQFWSAEELAAVGLAVHVPPAPAPTPEPEPEPEPEPTPEN